MRNYLLDKCSLYLQNSDIIVPRVECAVIFVHDDFGDLVALAAVHVHAARPDAHIGGRTAEKATRAIESQVLNRSTLDRFGVLLRI
jgi:hypothetical protein